MNQPTLRRQTEQDGGMAVANTSTLQNRAQQIVARNGLLIAVMCLIALLSCWGPSEWFKVDPCADQKLVSNKAPAVTSSHRPSYYYDLQPTELISSNTFHGVKARAFEKWQGKPIPCFPPGPMPDKTDKRFGARERGLFYLKLVKTGGSTCNGINAHIARNVANRTNAGFDRCESNFGHSLAEDLCPNRSKTESFLWTTLRDPTSRALSRFFFFAVSRGKREPSDVEFIAQMSKNCDHYQRRLLTDRSGEKDPAEYANMIMNEYNFIGITERMEESTVALSMVLGVPLADVLYLDAKHNGGYDEGTTHNDLCIYIVPTFVSPTLEDFFQTQAFQDCVRFDHILFQVANRSLDLTIDKLGRNEFEIKLEKFRAARTIAQTKCKDVVFPCSSGGLKMNKTDCLWQDSGCGFNCLDQVSTELNLWE